jgi:hypothetical protein
MGGVSTILLLLAASPGGANSVDPQLKTDHPFFQGELTCSTFDRLFKAQADMYGRETGRKADNDEDKAIASWYWRNLHFFHCTLAQEPDILGKGKSENVRDYWTSLFSYGHAICGSTHAELTAEYEYLLGHCRSRVTGVDGHNSLEVWLSGGPYGAGKWVLLDSDITTICFDKEQKALMNIEELVKADRKALLTNRTAKDNRGWLPELVAGDGVGTYTHISTYSPLEGYAGVPPVVDLRPGESLRRFPRPGFEEGLKGPVVFWGNSPDGVVGPNRHTSNLSDPEHAFNATARPRGEGDLNKRARTGNAVFTYKPDFKGGYKAGVAVEDDQSVTLVHNSPYVVACNPAKKVTDPGCTLGLVLAGKAECKVCVSTDHMKTFSDPVDFKDGLDLTDLVKGHYQYWLKFMAPATALAAKDVVITTRCMANGYILPHLKAGKTQVTFNASGLASETIGPQAEIIKQYLSEGDMAKGSFAVKFKTPHGEKIKELFFAARAASGCPPKPDLAFKAEYSTDGKEWKILRDDWRINPPAPYNPPDTWSQSFFFGSKDISADNASEVQVRLSNNKGKNFMMGQFSLLFPKPNAAKTRVTYCWDEAGQEKTAEHVYPAAASMDASWTIETGKEPKLKWVDLAAVE